MASGGDGHRVNFINVIRSVRWIIAFKGSYRAHSLLRTAFLRVRKLVPKSAMSRDT